MQQNFDVEGWCGQCLKIIFLPNECAVLNKISFKICEDKHLNGYKMYNVKKLGQEISKCFSGTALLIFNSFLIKIIIFSSNFSPQ